ncbi:hypothetical protein [Devosia sp.]|uniref:hypothetical protein n=1 Tax=Devosia sp. TaxID=1871048 RepID=UPI0019D935F4|nr:hypothetical protein [Devosia sp.]MBE0577831.1 hypothetical protein [Devosia sp.]
MIALYPDEDEVKEILKPFEGKLMEAHLNAFARWIASPERATNRFQRTMSTMMYDFIVQEVGVVLDDLPGVHRIDRAESVKYLFDDRVLVRFKRGNKDGLGRNIETKAEYEFIDPRECFMGLPEIWKVEALWYPNKLATKLDKVKIVARDINAKIWSYEIGAEADTALLPTPLPIIPIEPAARAPLVSLRDTPKKTDQEKK